MPTAHLGYEDLGNEASSTSPCIEWENADTIFREAEGKQPIVLVLKIASEGSPVNPNDKNSFMNLSLDVYSRADVFEMQRSNPHNIHLCNGMNSKLHYPARLEQIFTQEGECSILQTSHLENTRSVKIILDPADRVKSYPIFFESDPREAQVEELKKAIHEIILNCLKQFYTERKELELFETHKLKLDDNFMRDLLEFCSKIISIRGSIGGKITTKSTP